MGDLLRLLFLVPVGYIAAVFAAALTVLAGWYGHQSGAILNDFGAIGYVVGVGVWVVLQVGALTFIPALVIIVVAELFGWRSVFFYLAAGGVLGALAGGLNGLIWDTPHDRLLLLAAGFVGGLAYWLVAGRLSGLRRTNEAPPAPPAASAGDRNPD